MEIRTIQRSGGSLVVAIPPAFLNTIGLSRGCKVEIKLTANKTITISTFRIYSEDPK